MLIITTFGCEYEEVRKRKGVIISSRVHPGETGSSFMLKGIIDYLLGPCLGARMLRDLQSDLANGVLEVVAADWADVQRIAEALSDKHTARGGHRFADILHVATALHLASPWFLSFDARQRELAEAEGMELPL